MSDLLLSGGSILTMDDDETFYDIGHIEIADGVISSIAPGKMAHSDDALDASRSVVLPGLINAHTHLFIGMWRGLSDDRALFPWLEVLSPAIGLMNDEDMLRSNYLGCMEAILTGSTTVCECCRYEPQITARVATELGLRSISGGMPASEWFGQPLLTDLPKLAENTREIVDNPDQYGGLALAHLGVHSPYNCSSDFIKEAKSYADDLGIPFNIHLAECTAEIDLIQERYGKTPVQHLHDIGALGPGMIANHCVLFSEEDMMLFRDSGAGVAHNPISNAKLFSGIAPVKRYLEMGIPVGLATDSVVSNNTLNMFEEMYFGVLMQRVAPSTDEMDPLTAHDYLHMATRGSAKVLGMDDIVGAIEPGKRADLIVVQLPPGVPNTREHIMSHLVYSTSPRDISLVIVDGRVVARNGKLELVDGDRLSADLSEYFAARWEQVGPQLSSA